MDRIWTWIARANARLVLIGALLGLIAVGGWQAWREINPETPILPQAPTHFDNGAPSRLPLLDFIAARQTQPLPLASDPFETTTRFLVATPPVETTPEPEPEPVPEPQPEPTPEPKPTPEPEPVPEPEPEPKPEPRPRPRPRPDPEPEPEPEPVIRTMRLSYNGMFVRPDGIAKAWIENSETGTRHFYGVGDDIDGIRIVDISGDTLSVGIADETIVTLSRGVDGAAEFEAEGEGENAGPWRYRAPEPDDDTPAKMPTIHD